MLLASQRKKAYAKGGWRERYAMKNGMETVCIFGGHDCLRYTYSEDNEYQDANGATWDMVKETWI